MSFLFVWTPLSNDKMSLKNKIAKNIRLIRIQREEENKCVLKIYV